MKLKAAKHLLLFFAGLTVVFLLLCSQTKNLVFGYLAIACAFTGAAIWLVFGRCPACGGFLGRLYGKYCPHCGEPIDESSPPE